MTAKPYRSHEDATVESFAKDPEYAAEYLNAVLEDGDEAELLVALSRIAKAFGGVQAAANELERARDEAWAECDALRKDAERWRHCNLHGFPVRNQTTTMGKAWVAFRVIKGLNFVYYGNTAEEAVDAAIDAAMGEKP